MEDDSHLCTPENAKKFLRTLARIGSVRKACQEIGISEDTAHDWRANDPEFASRWEIAFDRSEQAAFDELHERAICGVEKGVYYRGKKIDTEIIKDTNALIYLLERRRPFRWGDPTKIRPAATPLASPGGLSQTLSWAERDANTKLTLTMEIEEGGPAPEPKPLPIAEARLIDAFRGANPTLDSEPHPMVEDLDVKDLK